MTEQGSESQCLYGYQPYSLCKREKATIFHATSGVSM